MGGRPTDATHRRIRALYATGPLGALGDSELLRRFATGEGLEREDAFAVLARRHGPMVLSTCRRMLGGDRATADDAFQAVFLVLARKAGSLRRPDDLRPWLYGVAVKAGKEARRRAARIHAREGGTLDDLPAPGADADLFDLRAAIDEELERLPTRYREPILLCELEGASRRDAAERLGLAEGTLSSRLARGRSLLRERLARRGLAVGALGAALAPPASGAAALADAAIRLAIASPSPPGAPETASAAAAVAEGVLAMLAAAKFQALATTAAALGLLVLTAGLARGLTGSAHDPDAAARAERPEAGAKPGDPRIRGVVVDEDGRPLAGAEVRLDPFTPREVLTTTGADGSYAMTAPGPDVEGRMILARAGDGRRLGTFTYGYKLSPAEAEAPIRIVVGPAREVLVRVADAAGKPVAGAMVEAAGDHYALASATSDAAGEARIAVPADRRVQWIVARKSAVGCDYAEFGNFDKYPDRSEGVRPAALPPFVALTLGEPRTVKIRAVDEEGAPVADFPFYLWLLKKDGRRGEVNYWSRLHEGRTGPDGVAVFDWLPGRSKGTLTFWPNGDGIAHRRVSVEPGQAEAVARLIRNVPIRGRVTLPDGSPAGGVKVEADGSGAMDHGRGSAVTAADGRYEMAVPPDEVYAVHVEAPGRAATARMDVVVRPGRPVGDVDFRLMGGTLVKGRVTIGPDHHPADGVNVRVEQAGRLDPDEHRGLGDWAAREVSWSIFAMTDHLGRYEARLAPGKYTLLSPSYRERVEIEVADEPELVRDFHLPRPNLGPVAGRVVDPAGKPVADASVEFAPVAIDGVRVSATTDADGQFATERRLVRTFVRAMSPDGGQGALVEIDPDDAELALVLAPTATAAGRLLDEKGEPARREKLHWGRRIPCNDDPDGPHYSAFAPEVVTDDDGRFTLPSLVVGQKYDIGVRRENRFPSAGFVRPERPGAVELGTLRVGAGRDEEASVFGDVAPAVGAVAPAFEATTLDEKPLALGDFAGKYVLLDFWATWCGPCVKEMPHIRAVHDEFGEDDRLAIVGLSLDDSIDALRRFQAERKLPWTIGRLEGGVRSVPNAAYELRSIPALFLIGPDGKILARGMRGEGIREAVAKALADSR
ncbi:sigma-70 family RNA polymerase sigma factor [Paludisphaera sp.]|uniref:sigma-70 family RNA polymerase sigma factor n=1 Tax=Paludisphaera sp. TaxID=2017432 RepID=UPI00301C508D